MSDLSWLNPHPMQSLCTLRDHCRQGSRNTRYQAGAAPYLDRSSTGWIAPACLAHLFDHLVGAGEQRRRHVERDSQDGIYGISSPAYIGLMPAKLTTLAHFSVSSAMSLPKSAGEPTSGVPPKSASLAFILGSARPALISLLSMSMISTGVPLGA